jgi:hypothetical protein
MYQLKNFTSDDQALRALTIAKEMIDELMVNHLHEAKTKRIIHDEPEVHRIWWDVGEVRVALHRIFPCKTRSCFFHPHPWPTAVECMKGGYTNRVAIYNGPKEIVKNLDSDTIESFSNLLIPMTLNMVPGSICLQPDIRQFHQVEVQNESYSIFLQGTPHFEGATKRFSRVAPINNPELTEDQIYDILRVTELYLRK